MDMSADEVIFIGNDLYRDIYGANLMKIKSVFSNQIRVIMILKKPVPIISSTPLKSWKKPSAGLTDKAERNTADVL